MTPRERLEAAGWTRWYDGRWLSPNGDLISEAQALAILARDEAKETSDDDSRTTVAGAVLSSGADASAHLDSDNPSAAAPVATSVSAPELAKCLKAIADFIWGYSIADEGEGLHEHSKTHNNALAIAIGEIFDPQDNAPLIEALREYASSSAPLVNRPTDGKTPVASERQRSIESVSVPTEAELEKQWIADGSTNSFKTWLIRKVQGASSSSAALDWAENMIAHYLKCGYLPELSAVEAKNFLGEPLPDKQKWSNPYDELREARDSRDRLQELADELVKTDGHRLTPRCSFAGCDCGGVEAYKVARSNYVRERRAALGDPPQKGGAH